MRPRIDLITIVTNNLPRLVTFYQDVMGFKIKQQLDNYVEFKSESVRFAITTNKVMKQATSHSSYDEESEGQSFELAFPVSSPGEVDRLFKTLVDKGATIIKSPQNMPWNQRTAFFADPDGNIHEIFTDL